MAKAEWCTVTPTSGKENGTINISASAHPGRDTRNTTIKVTATSGNKPSASINVSQVGVGVKLTMDATKPDIPGSGGTVIINGTSNSATLKILSMLLTNLGVTGNLKVNSEPAIGITTTNGTQTITIPGDPGATGVYNFIITLILPRNPLTSKQPFPLSVTDSTDNSAVCVLAWLPGAPTMSVDKNSLSLVNGGTGQAVDVISNDDWTIS